MKQTYVVRVEIARLDEGDTEAHKISGMIKFQAEDDLTGKLARDTMSNLSNDLYLLLADEIETKKKAAAEKLQQTAINQ